MQYLQSFIAKQVKRHIIQSNAFLVISDSSDLIIYKGIFENMIKSIKHILSVFFIFQQLKFQISQIDPNGYNPFCDETLHL